MSTPTRPMPAVVLDGFQIAAAPRSTGHPERASTGCPCRSPEPCYEHDPARASPRHAAPEVSYAEYVASLAAGATPEQAAGDPVAAPSVCQCSAPDPCREHCDDRPLLRRPPGWNDPHPDSPVARTRRRLEHDRALGVLPGAEPGQGVDVLPFLTDHELGAWTHALLAEHHRRQQRFADYRGGARAAQIRDDARRLA